LQNGIAEQGFGTSNNFNDLTPRHQMTRGAEDQKKARVRRRDNRAETKKNARDRKHRGFCLVGRVRCDWSLARDSAKYGSKKSRPVLIRKAVWR
jgi:hypothetical protein